MAAQFGLRFQRHLFARWKPSSLTSIAEFAGLAFGQMRMFLTKISFNNEGYLLSVFSLRSVAWVFCSMYACHGITAHKTLLLTEFATMKGWLFEVVQDLNWLSSFAPCLCPTSLQGSVD